MIEKRYRRRRDSPRPDNDVENTTRPWVFFPFFFFTIFIIIPTAVLYYIIMIIIIITIKGDGPDRVFPDNVPGGSNGDKPF